ncbi:peptidase S24 [Flavobacterium jejuense]|uniref:Peptidase S24 n=1 Tax=Flavobacterium jejuense TaxID=1544455 RepID=A0ABX0ISE6_9FLAO|nr:S24 family peptidase [Flavobacterium jejuense]NHN26797.1 peptidase S24 [Flavobacterium jejuense]
MSKLINKSLILNELKSVYGFKKDTEFADFLGIKPQTLSSWYTRNTFDIELLYAKCENVNADFLLSGEGNIIKNSMMVNEPSAVYGLKTDKNITDHQQIPLYNIEATAGIVTLFNDTSQTKPIDYIQIPNLPKCDGAIYVTGDSMYPLLKSGDIVMYKQIHNIKDGIFWGEMYLVSMEIDGEEHVTVKYIQKSEKGEDHVKLVSQNKHHQDKDIKIQKIRALALIKASVRINSMS